MLVEEDGDGGRRMLMELGPMRGRSKRGVVVVVAVSSCKEKHSEGWEGLCVNIFNPKHVLSLLLIGSS